MDRLASIIAGSPNVRRSNDDDFADRLSSRYTVVILIVFAILVSMNQYVRNPITCWAPVHFTKAHISFTTNYCWVKNTYYLPWESEVPRQTDYRQMVPYYQWIPFILLAQAVLFYVPTLIWHGLNSKSGVDADNILAAANTFSRTEKVETQDKTLMMLTNQLDRFLRHRVKGRGCSCDPKSILSATCCRLCGRRLGNYLLLLFVFSKICYIGNVVIQLFLLNVVLATKYSTFGIDMVRELVNRNDWTEESYVAFPRVTFCDFRIRGQDLGNVQAYTVQCVLPINLYNEKIYLFLWFWMIFVAGVSAISLLVWICRAIFFSDRVKFVRNHLMLGDRIRRGGTEGELIRKFTNDYLKQDGAFLLRLVAHNTNNITTTEVMCALWDFWKEKIKEKEADRETKGLYPDPDPENADTQPEVKKRLF